MGQNQLLLIILSLCILGVAISIGVALYNHSAIKSNQDAIINDVENISAFAKGFYNKPKILGGGGGSFTGFDLPSELRSNSNGDYLWNVIGGGQTLTLTANSRLGFGTVITSINNDGALSTFTYTGDFVNQ